MGGFCFMTNYVKCRSCDWRVNRAGYDPSLDVCSTCKNIRLVPDPKEILCNNCGGPARPLGTMNEQFVHGIEVDLMGGYDSYHLLDMNHYKFNICEQCIRKMFSQFKIPPKVYDHYGTPDYGYEEDKESYEYKVWKDTGGHHQAYLDGMCNSIKDCPNKAIYSTYNYERFSEDSCCEEHGDTRKYSGYKLVPFISNKLKVFL